MKYLVTLASLLCLNLLVQGRPTVSRVQTGREVGKYTETGAEAANDIGKGMGSPLGTTGSDIMGAVLAGLASGFGTAADNGDKNPPEQPDLKAAPTYEKEGEVAGGYVGQGLDKTAKTGSLFETLFKPSIGLVSSPADVVSEKKTA